MTTRLTAEQIDALEKLEAASTAGPWHADIDDPESSDPCWTSKLYGPGQFCIGEEPGGNEVACANLIVALRNSARELLAAARRERRQAEQIRELEERLARADEDLERYDPNRGGE